MRDTLALGNIRFEVTAEDKALLNTVELQQLQKACNLHNNFNSTIFTPIKKPPHQSP